MLPRLDWLYDNENEHDDNGDYQMTTVRSSDRAPSTSKTKNNDYLNRRVYDRFVNAQKSPATAKTYTHALMRYMQFHGFTRIEDLLVDSENPSSIESKIEDFLTAMKNNSEFNNVSFSTRHSYLFAILSFYELNDIEIRKKRVMI